jgi:lipopolysaccharide/colanic/teichoic acid biosynthesis glycosyltransferase
MPPSAFRLLIGRPSDDGSISETYLGLDGRAASRSVRSPVKRMMDLLGSSIGLMILAPVIALVALAIRLDSKGPILFRQPRMGLGGRTFHCLKFRTMVPDAEARLEALETQNESDGGVLFKIKDDPRVTKLGRMLRKTSLDELPQLWNVLVGEMSLIGPRPLQIRDSLKLEAKQPAGYARRLSVTPGISGPWQVAGRSEINAEGMLDLDLNYIETWSVAKDVELIVKTLGVVFTTRGAS